jgi:hypothetical protein
MRPLCCVRNNVASYFHDAAYFLELLFESDSFVDYDNNAKSNF